jgi:hypothetical protein
MPESSQRKEERHDAPLKFFLEKILKSEIDPKKSLVEGD